MKKVIAVLSFIFIAGLAQAQTESSTRLKFDYYPELNVYFDISANSYWYPDAAGKWVSAASLPANYSIKKDSEKKTLYYDGHDIWKNNSTHIKMFAKRTRPAKPTER
ncbi:MAG: hypothetical protein ABJB11_11025 [Ferruginibacter sp.]